MLSIRVAEPKDILSVYELVDSYVGVKFDPDVTKNNLRDAVYGKNVLLFDYRDIVIGGICGYTMNNLFTNERMFCVMFFYVLPAYRRFTRSIVKQVESLLDRTNVAKIVFGIMNNEHYETQKRFMRILGYSDLETHFIKAIQ